MDEVEDVHGKLEAANGGVDVFGLFVEVLLAVLNAARGHVGLSHGFYFLEAVELTELVHDAVELVQERDQVLGRQLGHETVEVVDVAKHDAHDLVLV